MTAWRRRSRTRRRRPKPATPRAAAARQASATVSMIAAAFLRGDQSDFARPYCRIRRRRLSVLAEVMIKRVVPLLVVCLVAAASAHAQSGPGRGRGGGGGGRTPSGGSSTPAAAATPAPKPPKPENQIEIVGVVRGIDPDAKRITIAYEAVEGLNWPAGTMPFTVYNADLLKAVSVGQRVRFKLDSQQITDLTPYELSRPAGGGLSPPPALSGPQMTPSTR